MSRHARGRAGAARAGARRDPRQSRLSAGAREIARRGAGADRACSARCSRIPSGQLTIQAQTEHGVVDLLVCDYMGGELRGYIRHDPDRLAEAGPHPTLFALFGKGYLAITFDQPATDERYQGIVPLEGEGLAQAAQSYFSQSEQIPSIVRLAARKDETGWVAGGLMFQHLARGRGGPRAAPHPARPSRMAARRGARRVGQGGGADRPRAAARRPRVAPVPRGRGSAHAGAGGADQGVPLQPRLYRLGDRALPGRGARRRWSARTG